MKSKTKRILKSVLALTLSCAMVLGIITIEQKQTVQASANFDGIDTLISNNAEENPLDIVELVPDTAMAEFGLWIDGEEPYDLETTLASTVGPSARAAYVTGLASKYNDIIGTGSILSSSAYEEAYAVSDATDWNQLHLSAPESMTQGTPGYKMVAATNGNYTSSNASYVAVSAGSGSYVEDISYYSYTGTGYYDMTFVAVSVPDGSNYTTELAGADAYEVVSATAILNEDALSGISSTSKNIYSKSVDLDGVLSTSYEFVGKANAIDPNTLDFENNYYFTVAFRHVSATSVDSYASGYLYKVNSAINFDPTQIYEYSAVVNDENSRYILQSGGNFNLSGTKSYTYVSDGSGSYNLEVGTSSESLDGNVYGICDIYYKGGLSNNDFFQNYVFNQDGTLASDVEMNVETMTPAMLAYRDISSVDLLYIAGTPSKFNSSVSTVFSSSNDISWDTAEAILEKAKNSTISVIADYSIINGKTITDSSTNLEKMLKLLSSTSLYSIDDFSSVDWTNLTAVSDGNGDGQFLNGSTYFFPGNSTGSIPYVFQDFNTSFGLSSSSAADFLTAATNAGFADVATQINAENADWEEDHPGETHIDLKISKAIVVAYILSRKTNDNGSWNYEVNVLDIEPYAVTDDTLDAIQDAQISAWFSDQNFQVNEVNVTHVSTAEFIGRIEDLSQYDMIYFGLSVDLELVYADYYNNSGTYSSRANLSGSGLQKNGQNYTINSLDLEDKLASGAVKTVYNDWTMNGLIYTNVGDITVLDESYAAISHSGLLESDYNHDGSGARTSLKDLDNSVVRTVGGSRNVAYLTMNKSFRYSGNDLTLEKVDDIYDYVLAGYPVVFADGFFTTSGGSRIVNGDRVDNCSNIYDMVNALMIPSEASEKSDGKMTGNYDNVFTVSEAESTKTSQLYSCVSLGKPIINLVDYESKIVPNTQYVDVEGSTIEIKFYITTQTPAASSKTYDCEFLLDMNADGKFSNTQEKIIDTEYRLVKDGTRIEPLYSESKGYYYELSVGSGNMYTLYYDLPSSYVGVIPWKIKIAQNNNEYRYSSEQGYVNKNNNQDAEVIKILQISADNGQNFNMQSLYEDSSSLFHKYVADLPELCGFQLDITTISDDTYYENYKENNNYLKQYDMLVLGFNDMYNIYNTNNAMYGIRSYIEDGYPVLFTHDCTSFMNTSTNPYATWGYYFNQLIRDVVGMDRYGILNNEALQSGEILTSGTDEYNSAVAYAEENDTDIAYVPKSNRTQIAKQNQGFTYVDLQKYAFKENSNYAPYYVYNGLYSWSGDVTTKVQQVNSGQITTYPYIIPEEFTVSDTHEQYYQLDMNEDQDDDGECDIVVWYTLADTSSDTWRGTYNVSPKDVRNNYYIYTKGNITYSGVGHSSITSNENELKLYINTMIAAYNSGRHAPSVITLDSKNSNALETDTVYYSFDESLDEFAEMDNQKTIYFSVSDSNLVKNLKEKKISIDYYIKCDEGDSPDTSITGDDGVIYLKKPASSWTLTNTKTGEVVKADSSTGKMYLTAGVVYSLNFQVGDMKISDEKVTSNEIYLLSQTELITYASDHKTAGKSVLTPIGYKAVHVQKISLFDLD